ncbi:MAG: hypothetical protein AAGB04_02185 [Pseudomonadota bacterium]
MPYASIATTRGLIVTQFPRHQIRQLAIARKRPVFGKLGDFDGSPIARLLEIYRTRSHENNLAEVAKQRAARGAPMGDLQPYLSDAYAQIPFQTLKPGGDSDCRYDYTKPIYDDVARAIDAHVDPNDRAQLAASSRAAKLRNTSMIRSRFASSRC